MKEQTFLCTVNSKKTAPSSPLNLIITPLKSPESTAGKWPRIQEPPGIFPAFTISLIARSFHFAFRTLFLPADNSMFFINMPGAPKMPLGRTSVMHCSHNFYFALELYYSQAAHSSPLTGLTSVNGIFKHPF